MNKTFSAQSKLVMDVLPFIAEEKIFALKGGTAINFFVRDLPRLSVDVDLTYCPIESRDVTLKKSNEAFDRIIDKLKSRLGAHVVLQRDRKDEFIAKIDVQSKHAQIKIEPNFVFRGSVYPFSEMKAQPKVSEILERTVKMQVLSFEDLYAGKLCATLNCQHPRDLFDMKLLLDIVSMLASNEKQFLISLVQLEPKWDLLSLPIDIKALPGIKFKLINLEKMESKKRKKYVVDLQALFK